MKINARKLYKTKDMTRLEWLKARQKGIGGSDAAAVCGLKGKWASPFSVYISKVDPDLQEDKENRFLEWGNRLEPVVREAFAEKHPEYTVKRSFIMWQHPEHDFMIANLDGLLYHPEKGWGILEIKTTDSANRKAWDVETVPEDYLIQIQHCMAVTGLKWGYFATLIGGNDDRYWYVERDDELIESLISIEKNFWENHVVPQIPPVLDGSQASEKVLAAMHPPDKVNDDETELPEEAEQLFKQYEEASAAEKEFTLIKKEAANRLKKMVGDYKRGIYGGRKVTWSRFYKENFNKDQFKQDHPDIYEKYIEQKPSSQFRIG